MDFRGLEQNKWYFMAHYKDSQGQGRNSNYIANNKRNTLKRESEGDIWLTKITEGKKSAEDILSLIVSEIEAKPGYYKYVAEICTHLDRIMRFFYEDLLVKAVPFGSAATNLAIRNSDVDIFLDFRGNLPEPPHKLLNTLKNKVRKYGYFIKTIPISAKTPIIQAVHRSGVSCDLSFVNAAGVFNSQLIKFLLSLDVRIRPLVLIIKYLIKRQGLLGPHGITSYALVVLIVYFLQTLKNPIIPSIILLQNLAKKSNFVADWDMSFTTDTKQLPTVNNTMSVTELTQKFFHFYSTFEFGFYVICTYTGKSYLKTIFSDTNLLPEEFHMYKRNLQEGKCEEFGYNKFMCVQDPFHHCTNITRNTIQKSLIQFQQLCSIYCISAIDLYDNNIPEEKKIKYLINLIEEKMDEPKSKITVVVEPIIIFVGQNLAFNKPNCSEDDLRKTWSENTFNAVLEILSKVMKCELDIQVKELGGATTSSENCDKIIKCELLYRELITKKRNEVRSNFDFHEDMPIINQEEIISNFLCETVLKNSTKISFKFEIDCTVKREPTRLCMQITPEEQDKAKIPMVQQILKFLQTSFTKWIK